MFSNMTVADLFRLFLPSLLGFFVSSLPNCQPGSHAGSVVKFRPPGYVFGIVWPILYLLLGSAWVYTIKKLKNRWVDLFYGAIVFFLTSWIVVYGCYDNKKGGVYAIFLGLLATLMATQISELPSRLMLTPLVVWLIFAGLLNAFEVQLS